MKTCFICKKYIYTCLIRTQFMRVLESFPRSQWYLFRSIEPYWFSMAEWCGCIGFALDDTWPGEHKDLEKIWYMLLIFSIRALYICSFILGFWWSPTSEFSGTWIQRYNSLWAKTLQSTMDGSIVNWYWILAKKNITKYNGWIHRDIEF